MMGRNINRNPALRKNLSEETCQLFYDQSISLKISLSERCRLFIRDRDHPPQKVARQIY